MSRVRRNVVVQRRNFWALFDTGSRNTYVVPEVASLLPTFDIPKVESVALGGRAHRVEQLCVLSCLVEGLEVYLHARILQEIGTDEEGKRIEILFGALALEEWGIVLLPHENRLDTSHYPHEFVEFMGLPPTAIPFAVWPLGVKGTLSREEMYGCR
jgi:hypothetical protein